MLKMNPYCSRHAVHITVGEMWLRRGGSHGLPEVLITTFRRRLQDTRRASADGGGKRRAVAASSPWIAADAHAGSEHRAAGRVEGAE